MRDFVFLRDSRENVKASKPRMRLKRIAGVALSINHNVLTLATSSKTTVKKYVCNAEEGATDRVCS